MIHNVDPQLSQWDVGRIVSVADSTAKHIHFANQGDSKAVIIEIINGEAKVPDFLLQTGKTLIAYAVLNGVTLESKSFPVRKRERPENYVYEDDQRNYIYELIADTENAIEGARTAAESANLATENASKATASATVATDGANKASENANLAAKNANEAAVKAANTAKSLMVVGGASGEIIALNDAIEQYFVGLRVFGKTMQDGVPTPDAPVELVSVGDSGSVAVNVTGKNDSNGMAVATPNGLPGIPVASGGNYTDANGQQWICDEIDFARGVRVKRVHQEVITADKITYVDNQYFSTGGTLVPVALPMVNLFASDLVTIVSNYAAGVSFDDRATGENIYKYRCYATQQTGYFNLRYPISAGEKTVEEAKKDFAGASVKYILATPIETPLSEEELAAYAALHTYKDHTTVFNDASAHMEIEYVMDAKKYIDNLVISGGGSVARLTSVTLLASSWTGSNSLYSQVVSIPGITEYSKVDLLPSMEQLAIFHNKDVEFTTENVDGVVTVYAIGDKPVMDYTMQAQITEVLV